LLCEQATELVEMPPPSRTQAPLNGKDKVSKKEHILSVLNRMNDKDTQKGAADDLREIVNVSAVHDFFRRAFVDVWMCFRRLMWTVYQC
jgi:hypothetical protein